MVRHGDATDRATEPVISIQEARRIVVETTRPLSATEVLPIAAATGRVLAQEVISDTDLPPFDRVMMDGFALRAADLGAAGNRLPVSGQVAAGDEGATALTPGTALSIMTGAPLPPGADAVVPIERTERDGEQIVIEGAVAAGANVAPKGEDLARGQVVAVPGDEVTTLGLSLLISAGVGEVAVLKRPLVALLTSGNELVPPGTPLRRGQIRESNGPSLASLFRACGADVLELGVAEDTREALAARFEKALAADVIVLTGGASVGQFDYSAEIVADAGATPLFDKVAVKPGKPTIFCTREAPDGRPGDGPQLVFCLPGNPVAALMTGRVLVAPAIARRGGRPVDPWAAQRLPLAQPVRRNGWRDLILPMQLRPREGGDELVFEGWHGSGDLVCMSAADGFAYVASGDDEAPAGALADFFPLPRGASW